MGDEGKWEAEEWREEEEAVTKGGEKSSYRGGQEKRRRRRRWMEIKRSGRVTKKVGKME